MQGDYYKKTGIYHRPDSKPEKAMEKELKKTKNTKAPKTNDAEETEVVEDKKEE